MSSSRYIQKVYASDESGVGEDSATQSARQRTEVFRAGNPSRKEMLCALTFHKVLLLKCLKW